MASSRTGVFLRRAAGSAVVLCVVALNSPRVGERPTSPETRIITMLRAISAAQMLHASDHRGQYADRLEIVLPEPWRGTSRHGYDIELLATGEHYTVIAVPAAGASGPRWAFCMGDSGDIYKTPNGLTPAVDAGQCCDRSRPLQ